MCVEKFFFKYNSIDIKLDQQNLQGLHPAQKCKYTSSVLQQMWNQQNRVKSW